MCDLSFEDFDDSKRDDFERVKKLRAQLAVVDRAINLVGQEEDNGLVLGDGVRSKAFAGNNSKSGDESYFIDLMSSQLATCPQCLTEMDVKKLKSHTANSCPNKIIVCPELNCGCQLSLRHLRRHLSMECEITSKRRKLVSDAAQRKEHEAQRLKDEADQRRRDRAQSLVAPVFDAPHAVVQGVADSAAAHPSEQEGLEEVDTRYTTCPKCNESMRQSQLSLHLDKQCSRRRVMCPNYHNGCKQRLVPLFLLQTHLRSECAAEKHRDRMIARAAQRRELMKCPACGQLVPLMLLRKHERELCGNRRVRCRNHALGCGVMVRLKDRALHEHVDGNKAVRSALYLPGHGAHLAIGEDDLPCPWTAEYWIYRPPAKESLRMHLRNLALLLPKYHTAFAAEVCVKNQVMQIVRALNDSSTKNDASAAADAGKLSKEQRAQRARELTAQRMDLVNALTALVPQYTECVLAYMHAFQEIAVSVEAGYACAIEIVSEVGFRDTEKVNLTVGYPGVIASRPKSQFSFVKETAKRKQPDGTNSARRQSSSTTGSSRSGGASVDREDGGASTSSSRGPRRSEEGGDINCAEDAEAGEEGGSVQDSEFEPDPDQELLNELLLGEYEDYMASEEGLLGMEMEDDEDEGNSGEGREGGENGEVGEKGHEDTRVDGGDDVDASVASGANSRGSKASRAVAAAVKARRPVRVDYTALAAYLMSGSSIALLLKACLHLEDESTYYQAERHIALFSPSGTEERAQSDAVFAPAEVGAGEEELLAAQSVLMHPDLDLEYMVPRPPSPADGTGDGTPRSVAPPHDLHIPLENVSKSMSELQAQGVTAFLADVMLAPKRAVRTHALSWCSWRSLLEVMRSGLKADFDALQKWRVDAGLLKPDAVRSGVTGGKAELTAKQEKALEKKEKARLKREMKKQEKKYSGDATDSEGAALSAIAAPATGSSIATVVGGGKKEDTIFKRVGELFKAGCGSGVLAESSSTSKEEAVHSRICLSLGSGLSILRPNSGGAGKSEGRPASPLSAFLSGAEPASEAGNGSDREAEEEEGAEDDAEHYYDLLLRPEDLTRLARSHGKVGIVTVPQTVRDLTGMGDAQLQAYARELEEAAAEDGRLSSPSSKSSKLARRKRASGTAVSGSNGSTAAKKANSLVRLGMEARSFEVSVPRGKWTHIALVATALPQNKLTLYMDGLMVKTLKDCAFPLPMSALGGSAQSFESFEGALLDVRYWNVQRSSLEIIDNMHGLLDLEEEGSAADESGTGGRSSTSSSKGLVAWWTFEDGGGMVSAADVTGHRFKTLIQRRQNAVPMTRVHKKPSTPGAATGTCEVQTATSPSIAARAVTAPGEAQTSGGGTRVDGRVAEGVFTAEELARYVIPEEVRCLLPAPYQKLLPASAGEADRSAPASPAAGASRPASAAGPAIRNDASTPWGGWLSSLPRWSWLEAETLPTPKAVVLPSSLTRHEPPSLPPVANTSGATTKKVSSSRPVPRHAAGAISHKKQAPAESKSVLPVPSLRARGICPYELRRHRLATAGRELQREADCPLGCSVKIKMVEVRFHVRFVCQRRLVSCRFDFCHACFPIGQRAEHEQNDCQQMYARTKVLSQAQLHMTLFPCTLCSENVAQRDLITHQLRECPHRLVPCPYQDCGLGRQPSIQAHLLQHHLRFECSSPTRKERFMLVERARERVKYPRPWGIVIPLTGPEEDSDAQHSGRDMPLSGAPLMYGGGRLEVLE